MNAFEGYRGKRVLVTGASSGIGLATARMLMSLGAEVTGTGSREVTPSFHYVRFDLSDPLSIRAGVDALLGPIDILFNCAGAAPMAAELDILRVNYLGTRLLTELISESMPSGGAVVNVSSDAGYAWRKQRTAVSEFVDIADWKAAETWYEERREQVGHAYSFGKEAMNVWTLKESQNLIKRGIRINTVSPGAVQTPMLEAIETAYSAAAIAPVEQPIGRRSTPDEQAWPVIFLGSPAASYVNGIDLVVDGGYWASLTLDGALS